MCVLSEIFYHAFFCNGTETFQNDRINILQIVQHLNFLKLKYNNMSTHGELCCVWDDDITPGSFRLCFINPWWELPVMTLLPQKYLLLVLHCLGFTFSLQDEKFLHLHLKWWGLWLALVLQHALSGSHAFALLSANIYFIRQCTWLRG